MLPPQVGQYALSTMLELALSPDQRPVRSADIAERHGMPHQCLNQLLRKLERAELVHSQGPDLGYTLARDADGITVRDVLRAVEGSPDSTSRAEREEPICRSLERHPTHWLWAQRDQAVYEILDFVTLADLRTRICDSVPGTAASQAQRAGASIREHRCLHRKLLSFLDSLEAAHVFQQSIVDGLDEPIMVIGTDYRVQLMNRAASEFSATEVDPSTAVLCYQVSHRRNTPCDGTEHPCPLRQVRESGQSVTVVHEHYQASGERRIVELIASPLWGPDKVCQGIIESARDITERTQAERALRQYAQRLRDLGERLAQVSEAERQRLARELHDQVGRNLTALGINLNIVQAQMPADLLPAVRSRLEDSLSLVEQTTKQIRDVMADLRPPVLDDYGLFAALHWYAEQFAVRTGITVTVQGEEADDRLDPAVENALFRIAQEALNNVAKHAQASAATLALAVEGESLFLVVRDDGVGFDSLQLAERAGYRGWGLLTMNERAEAVGGHCSIESCPGRGTQVTVEVKR
jgi:Rrf2 family protein